MNRNKPTREETEERYSEADVMLDMWLISKNESDDEEEYRPSSIFGDYSPNCPWNAPGMCIDDFI